MAFEAPLEAPSQPDPFAEVLRLRERNEDKAAQELFVRSYYRLLLHHAYRHCPHAEHAEDVTQEALYRFFRGSWKQLRCRDLTIAHLLTMLKRVNYELLRKNPPTAPLDPDSPVLTSPPADTVLQEAEAELRLADFRECIMTLPPADQQLLEWRVLDGQSLRDVAARANCTRFAAGKRLGELMRGLRACFQRKGWDCPSGANLR